MISTLKVVVSGSLILVLVVMALIVVLGGLYLFLRWYKNKKRVNVRKATYGQLLHVSLDDPKKAAYEITKYGYLFKNDTLRNTEMYHNLVERLEKYKYKKEVDAIDEETKSYFELYKGMIDV